MPANSETDRTVDDHFLTGLCQRIHLIKKFVAAAAFFLMSLAASFADTVDFYATVSSSADDNMIKMTTDLLYTQLQSMDAYSVADKRSEVFTLPSSSPNISFYVDIQEDYDGGWICTLNAYRGEKNVSFTKKYDSYYKILMDSKASIENLLLNLSENLKIQKTDDAREPEAEKKEEPNPILRQRNPAMDILAGTWTGEELIEKILILRGGRGFIVFKNGASMNISVTVDGDSVKVKQTGKSNASFFPELPRQEALNNAATAAPIEWNLVLNGNTLEGTKKTLVSDKKASTGVSEGTINVLWTKVR